MPPDPPKKVCFVSIFTVSKKSLLPTRDRHVQTAYWVSMELTFSEKIFEVPSRLTFRILQNCMGRLSEEGVRGERKGDIQ